MLNGSISSWRLSFPIIREQVETVSSSNKSSSDMNANLNVGLGGQRSHVPALSQLGDKPF